MNGNGNGKKVRATETWPDAGAMEGSALWETCIGVLASGACRRSDVGGRSVVVNVFGAVLGRFRKNFILFCNIFSTLSTFVSPIAQVALRQTASAHNTPAKGRNRRGPAARRCTRPMERTITTTMPAAMAAAKGEQRRLRWCRG